MLTIDEFLGQDSSRHVRSKILGGIAIVVVVAISMCFIKIDVVESFQGHLIPVNKVKVVQSPQPGEVKRILVSDGTYVRAGQALAIMDTTISSAEIEKFSAQRTRLLATLERLNASLKGANPNFASFPVDVGRSEQELWVATEAAYREQREDLVKQINIKKISIEGGKASLEKAQGEYENASQQEALVRGGVGMAVSEFSYMNYKNAKLRSGSELRVQQATRAQETQELDMAIGKLRDVQVKRNEELIKQREQVLAEQASVDLELVKSRRKAVLTEIVSPEDGFVNQLKVTNEGQALNTAEVVATIVPKDQRLVLMAEAPTKDIALIAVGSPSHIKIDAYPYQIYGAIKGSVSWISADSSEDTTASGRERGGRHYNLESDVGEWELGTREVLLKPGMSATIDIVAQQKTLAALFFSPVIKNIDEAIRRP